MIADCLPGGGGGRGRSVPGVHGGKGADKKISQNKSPARLPLSHLPKGRYTPGSKKKKALGSAEKGKN